MQKDYEQYKERHLSFWSMNEVKNPLIAFTVGAGLDSWSYWQYNKAAQSLLNRGEIKPDDINPVDFVEDQLRYLELSEQIEDDVCRSAMPLASIPWMEAILGCPVYSTEAHMTCRKILDNIENFEPIPFSSENIWVKKYLEFIQTYAEEFSDKYPVAQSVLRGPADLACALLGAENAAMALITDPDSMHRLFDYLTDTIEKFLKLQLQFLPKFKDGYVLGQYELWAPEKPLRIQEDFSTLYSPQLFDEFLQPADTRIAAISNYTLIHLHSSSLYLIDNFLENSNIKTYQVTKDPGSVKLKDMMQNLIKIQQAGRPLVLKGQFEDDEFDLMKEKLSVKGLCIQPVVKNISEAQRIMPLLREWT